MPDVERIAEEEAIEHERVVARGEARRSAVDVLAAHARAKARAARRDHDRGLGDRQVRGDVAHEALRAVVPRRDDRLGDEQDSHGAGDGRRRRGKEKEKTNREWDWDWESEWERDATSTGAGSMACMGYRRGDDIAERLLEVGAAVVQLTRQMPRDAAGRHIAVQMIRSASSGGANYEEARRAESRADFVHKVGIAAKELGETLYWLRLIQRLGLVPTNLDAMLRETDELVAIFVASARTARSRE